MCVQNAQTICYSLIILSNSSHPFDGVPTFALIDYTLEFIIHQISFIYQKIFNSKNYQKSLDHYMQGYSKE